MTQQEQLLAEAARMWTSEYEHLIEKVVFDAAETQMREVVRACLTENNVSANIRWLDISMTESPLDNKRRQSGEGIWKHSWSCGASREIDLYHSTCLQYITSSVLGA